MSDPIDTRELCELEITLRGLEEAAKPASYTLSFEAIQTLRNRIWPEIESDWRELEALPEDQREVALSLVVDDDMNARGAITAARAILS